MRRLLPVLLAIGLAPTLGHAAFGIDRVSVSCSDTLTVTEGDALSLGCLGNLSLTGQGSDARLFADTSILLSAVGNVDLSGLSLVSPKIELTTTNGTISLSTDVLFFNQPVGTAPSVTLSAGGRAIRPELREPVSGSSTFTMDGGDVTLNWSLVTKVPGSGDVLNLSPVPEPSVGLLSALGVAGLLARRRLGRKQR